MRKGGALKVHTGAFLIAFIIVMSSQVSFAQDTSKVKPHDTVKSMWSGAFSFGGFYQRGNTNKLYGESKGELKRADGLLESIFSATLTYGETDDIKDENEIYSSLTFDLFYEDKFSPFVLQITQYDFGRNIDLRSQSGGGLKYTFIRIPELKASVSSALLYDYTNLADAPGNYDSRITRLSFRVKLGVNLFGSRIMISHFTFYQPSVKDFTNAIWRSESALNAPLTKFLFITSVYRYTHEDVVSVGRKKSDHKLSFGLGVNFK